MDGKAATISVEGRHDPCICPRVVPVAEAMVALTIFDHLTRHRLMARKTLLRDLRDTIDLVDRNIVLLLSERQSLVRQIGQVKKRRGKKIVDKRREREILASHRQVAQDLHLDVSFVEEMFRAIFKLAKTSQKEIGGK